jgi:hypothetical protein
MEREIGQLGSRDTRARARTMDYATALKLQDTLEQRLRRKFPSIADVQRRPIAREAARLARFVHDYSGHALQQLAVKHLDELAADWPAAKRGLWILHRHAAKAQKAV